jgi:hypothetical protein
MPTNESPGSGSNAGTGFMETIQQRAGSALDSQKSRAVDGITAVVEAVRRTGDQLREKNGAMAGYVDSAAGQLERWSSQLRDRDMNELMDDVTSFARRRPAVFVGGGVALGLLAARFLKSSAPHTRSATTGQLTQSFATSQSSAAMSRGRAGAESTAAGIAADRTGSRTPRTPRSRPQTTDER